MSCLSNAQSNRGLTSADKQISLHRLGFYHGRVQQWLGDLIVCQARFAICDASQMPWSVLLFVRLAGTCSDVYIYILYLYNVGRMYHCTTFLLWSRMPC